MFVLQIAQLLVFNALWYRLYSTMFYPAQWCHPVAWCCAPWIYFILLYVLLHFFLSSFSYVLLHEEPYLFQNVFVSFTVTVMTQAHKIWYSSWKNKHISTLQMQWAQKQFTVTAETSFLSSTSFLHQNSLQMSVIY